MKFWLIIKHKKLKSNIAIYNVHVFNNSAILIFIFERNVKMELFY